MGRFQDCSRNYNKNRDEDQKYNNSHYICSDFHNSLQIFQFSSLKKKKKKFQRIDFFQCTYTCSLYLLYT